MQRIGSILLVIALVAGMAAVPLGAAAAFSSAGEPSAANADADEAIEPGEQMAAVVGVQAAEIDGELSERAFGLQIANAESPEAKADIIADRIDEIEDRVAAHEHELESLAEAHEAGEISEGEYRAKVATVSAERAHTDRVAAQAQATAGELPEDVLMDRGINVTAIQELRAEAADLGGPETAEIARSIAGENVGGPVADHERGPPVDMSPDDGADTADAVPPQEGDDEAPDPDNASADPNR